MLSLRNYRKGAMPNSPKSHRQTSESVAWESAQLHMLVSGHSNLHCESSPGALARPLESNRSEKKQTGNGLKAAELGPHKEKHGLPKTPNVKPSAPLLPLPPAPPPLPTNPPLPPAPPSAQRTAQVPLGFPAMKSSTEALPRPRKHSVGQFTGLRSAPPVSLATRDWTGLWSQVAHWRPTKTKGKCIYGRQ